MFTENPDNPTLAHAETGYDLRPASDFERLASIRAAEHDNGYGIITATIQGAPMQCFCPIRQDDSAWILGQTQ